MLCRATVGQQLSAQRQTGSPKAIGEKAEVRDADEASGRDVLTCPVYLFYIA
jgi:hypothetical protein